MADERIRNVIAAKKKLRSQALERWRGFQRPVEVPTAGIPNRDGTCPTPQFAAPTAEQVSRFEKREKYRELFYSTAYRGTRLAAERKIGTTLDFSDLPPNEQALAAGRPVARIVTLGRAGVEPEGFATGFLVHPDLLLTNWHVFRTPDEADGTGAQFLFERVKDGIRTGLVFELDRQRFFLNDRQLDYALVAVKARSVTDAELGQFKFLPLIAAKGKILKGDPINIIQHPQGGPKQYATVNNRLLDLRDDGFLLYETDTLEGSSGSPVFNRHWEVIGLHHSGVPRMDGDQMVLRDGRRVPVDAEVADEEVDWIANEGIRTSALVDSLRRQSLADPAQAQQLAKLLESTDDPVAWIETASPAIPAPTPATSAAVETAMPSTLIQISGPVTVTVGAVTAPLGDVASHMPSTAASADATRGVAGASPFREKALRFDEDYGARSMKGYKSKFLKGWTVPAPGIDRKRAAKLKPLSDSKGKKTWVIPYYHYSLVMSEARRLLIWAASNVDYSESARQKTRTRAEYGGESWRLDPRIALAAPGLQIEDRAFYEPAKKIDRGHIVRREDGCWGSTAKEAEYGNSDTYHYSNCTPQHMAFNQSKEKGLWGRFENHIQSEVKAIGGRMVVFAGPVLSDADPVHGYEGQDSIRVPMEFWKVVLCIAKEGAKTKRYAYAFIFDQSDVVKKLGYEKMNMDDFEIHQVSLADLTKKTGITFAASVLAADVLAGGAHEALRGSSGKQITSLESLVLR